MRISLAAPSYTARSVVAAAQQTMNLIPEPVEVPNEPTRIALYGRPGLKLFCTMSPIKIRAMWAGGGRLFVLNGGTLTEVHQDGTQTPRAGTVAQGTSSPDPAGIFSNGHQLLVVSGGYAYCDNGSGPQQLFFSQTGTGNTVAASDALNWVSGPNFSTTWVGLPIIVGGNDYVVATVPSTTQLTFTTPTVDATGVTWVMPNPPNGTAVTAVTGGFLDGYFLVNRVAVPNTSTDPGRQFAISNLDNGLQWDPLDFGVKEGHSDYINSILCDHEELWLFGTETTEVWNNVGAPTFPFQRIPGAFIHQGSVATFAPASANLTVCWLGGGADGKTIAYQAQGLQPRRISTYAQETVWNSPLYLVSDAVTYAASHGGHYYWVINFWQQNQTFVYDLTTGMWHERASWNAVSHVFGRYQPWFHAFLPEWNNGHIVGDPVTGNLYQCSTDFTDDNGATIAYQRAMPHLINEDQWGFHSRFELYCESGTAAAAGPIANAILDWSDDRGHTFGPLTRTLSMGANGDFDQRLVARRLGRSRDRIYRVHIESTNKIALVDAYLEMTQGFA